MTVDDKIRDEKLKDNINIEAVISALSSSKIDKYEYLKSKEIWPPDQIRIIEHTKFTYSPLGRALEKNQRNRLILWSF